MSVRRAVRGEPERFIEQAPSNAASPWALPGMAEGRLPHFRKLGERYYNFWQDERNPRGVWRRTTLEEYRKAAPGWEVVLDLDALGRADGERWVFAGAPVLVPATTGLSCGCRAGREFSRFANRVAAAPLEIWGSAALRTL